MSADILAPEAIERELRRLGMEDTAVAFRDELQAARHPVIVLAAWTDRVWDLLGVRP